MAQLVGKGPADIDVNEKLRRYNRQHGTRNKGARAGRNSANIYAKEKRVFKIVKFAPQILD